MCSFFRTCFTGVGHRYRRFWPILVLGRGNYLGSHWLRGLRWAILPVAMLASGCLHTRLAEDELPPLQRLEEGDVVLMFSPNALSWIFSRLGTAPGHEPPVPLSHSEMLARRRDGSWSLCGILQSHLQNRSLRKALRSVSHIYVFRAVSSLQQRREAGQLAYEWSYRPGAREVTFDYAMRDIPGRHTEFYCAGFLNEVCRLKNLPPPFFVQKRPPSLVDKYLECICGGKPNLTPGIASIFANSQYRQVLSWRHPRLSEAGLLLVCEVTGESILSFCGMGWLPNGATLSSGSTSLSKAEQLRMLWRANRSLQLFSVDVTRMWKRLERRNRTRGLDRVGKEELLKRICRNYREKYFYQIPACDHVTFNGVVSDSSCSAVVH